MAIKFEVAQKELASALYRAGGGREKSRLTVSRIILANGILTIHSIGGSESLEVDSSATFDSGDVNLNVGKVALRLPEQDPLQIRLESHSIYLGALRLRLPSVPPRLADNSDRVAAAADALSAFAVNPFAIALLVVRRKPSKFSVPEQPLIEAIAKAWSYLAPFGVTPEDLREIVDESVRTSWIKGSTP